MLNIFKLKLKNNFKNVKININNSKDKYFYKNSDPSVRSWKNSIYTYNKNILSLIPEASKLTIFLIKGYFNLYSLKLVRILNKRLYKTLRMNFFFRRFLTNKIFISDGQFKHTNDLVNITIFFYNRQLSNYKKKMTKKLIELLSEEEIKKKIILIKKKGIRFLKAQKRKKNLYIKYARYNRNIVNQMNDIDNYKKWYFRKFIKKSLYNIKLYMYFRELIFLNVNKFNNYYLQNLTNLIKKIYKKNVIFNFINVKYFYFNSDIFTQSLTTKIRQNRRKVSKYLKLLVTEPKIENIQYNPVNRYDWNIKYLNKFKNIDITNGLLYDILFQNESKYLRNIVFNNINNKRISGIWVQLGGRLSKRNTASRSMNKKRIRGSFLNQGSTLYGRSSSLLRGTIRSNLDYTKINSKVRIGAFGVKGWISGA